MIIDFEITEGHLTLKDSLDLPEDHGLTDEEITAIQIDRFNAWKAFIEAASVDVEPIEPVIE